MVAGGGWYYKPWYLVEDKGDSCRWWSIGEESEIAWCDCDELEV